MNRIVLSESCFGPNVSIDGETLFQDEYDSRSIEEVRLLRMKLIDELVKNINDLDMSDLKTIGEIVMSRSTEFEFSEEDSSSDTCDQCGNYNSRDTYVRKVNNKS